MSHDHDLVSVHSCGTDGEAEIVIGLLKANEIDAFRGSDVPHSAFPVNADADILVNGDDEAEALLIIREHLSPQEEVGEA
jgi:hypothetical protein